MAFSSEKKIIENRLYGQRIVVHPKSMEHISNKHGSKEASMASKRRRPPSYFTVQYWPDLVIKVLRRGDFHWCPYEEGVRRYVFYANQIIGYSPFREEETNAVMAIVKGRYLVTAFPHFD